MNDEESEESEHQEQSDEQQEEEESSQEKERFRTKNRNKQEENDYYTTPKNPYQGDENSMIISLPLIKKFIDMRQKDTEEELIKYLTDNGLPSNFKDQHSLELYLYFHQMCIPFYKIFNSINSKNISDEIIASLKESYYLLAENEIKHYNFEYISQKIFTNLRVTGDDSEISRIPVVYTSDTTESSTSSIMITKFIMELGYKSKGRLDIYTKVHIVKAIIYYINNDDLFSYSKVFEQMESDLLQLYENWKKEKLDEKKYEEMVKIFIDGEMRNDWHKLLDKCEKLLIMFQNLVDYDSIVILEKLFIQLLGHFDREVRNNSVKMLNMIYDQTTWQEKSAFPLSNTEIKTVGENLTLELSIKVTDYSGKSIVLITSTPCQSPNINYTTLTFLKCLKEEEQEDGYENEYVKLIFPIGELKKCGYYDWYLVRFTKGRFLNLRILDKTTKEMVDGKGRIITLSKDTNDLSIHEVFCDLINANIDKNVGKIIRRGNFKTLEDKLDEYKNRYINCLYIMGALERDNDIAYDDETGAPIDIGNNDASPMAVTCRETISSLLGGEPDFKSLMEKAKHFNIKILIDCLSRVSSSRANRRYRKIMLKYIDSKGKLQICYGSDGKSVTYEDSAILNYRKIESWNLLIDEIKKMAIKYGIDGVHIDNCQCFPPIMEIDAAELYRIETDGKPAYSPMEILNGEIVMPSTEGGYWDTDLCDEYANPLLLKLTRSIWNDFPNFVFLGECWLNEKFSKRHINLTKSGIIPRMYTLPIIICEMLGKRILRNGNMESVQPQNVCIIKEWYKEHYDKIPEGAILCHSSSGQVWPYPALLYGRGNWSAVDLLFSLPEIPMTFMGEIDGEAFRVQITNVYETKDLKKNMGGNNNHNSSTNRLITRTKSLMKMIETKEQEQREREREKEKEKENNQSLKRLSRTGSSTNLSEYLPQYNLTESITTLINLSGVALNRANEVDKRQRNLEQELGFDLKQIGSHYDMQRKLRCDHECLRKGKLIYLDAFDEYGTFHEGIFSFARQTDKETGIFVINFRERDYNFVLDLSPLLGKLKDTNPNSICYIEQWGEEAEKGEFYFLKELTQGFANKSIEPYSTMCFGFSTLPNTQQNYKKTMENSNIRVKSLSQLKKAPASKNRNQNIQNQNQNQKKKGSNVDRYLYDSGRMDSHKLTNYLKEIFSRQCSLDEFSDWFSNAIFSMDDEEDICTFIRGFSCLKDDDNLATEFFKQVVLLGKSKSKGYKFTSEAEQLFEGNKLGTICFITPELGRWSTVGGLGIMVDELSQGLCSLGQDVIMISPYYNQNRKGQTDYLLNDPFNIKHIQNVNINLDGNYGFGIHYGTGNGGIKYYFIHNAKFFPKPYPDFNTGDTVREIACFAKASLQLLCDLNISPSVILTNDWFTGLVPAYGKNGSFGDRFKNTTFMHICHNLEPTYEGRLYFNPHNDGNFQNIYKFNPDWLIDPTWNTKVINPSRCAILMSDQWATVSRSYKKDLQTSSPLAHILNQKPNPFAFPNGVFKENRLKILNEKTGGGDKKECKKYIQQKYFGYNEPDYSVPIYSFVGRLTQQKGVLLILDAVEDLVRKTNGKINILVGGMGNTKDPYVGTCVHKINHLKNRYPYAFWANPTEFFTDGPKINVGSDFGLMPSLFEPGGIVQHEFFIAKTPVIAYRTGGLKDTVFEFNYDNNTGNGFTFENYNRDELINAIMRSLKLFENKSKYEICRQNAYKSTIDVSDVSKAWCKEFCRLRKKIFFNNKEVMNSMGQFPSTSNLKENENPMKKNFSVNSFEANNNNSYFHNNTLPKNYNNKFFGNNMKNNFSNDPRKNGPNAFNDINSISSIDSVSSLSNINSSSFSSNLNMIGNNFYNNNLNMNKNNTFYNNNINNNIHNNYDNNNNNYQNNYNKRNNTMNNYSNNNYPNNNNFNNNFNNNYNNNFNNNYKNNSENLKQMQKKNSAMLGSDEVIQYFCFSSSGPRPNVVQISGSFDGWKQKYSLCLDPNRNKWEKTIRLKKGRYLYKYIVDGNWQVNPNEPSETGSDGIVNNVIIVK